MFFDADGTVCDIKKGVPESALEAIRRLGGERSRGVAVHRAEPGVRTMVSGADPFYGDDQRLRCDDRKERTETF